MDEKLTPAFVAAGDQRPRCGEERPGTHPCIRVASECQGQHYDKLGRTWEDQDKIRPSLRCRATPPSGRRQCILVHAATLRSGDEVPHLDTNGGTWTTTVKRSAPEALAAAQAHQRKGRADFVQNVVLREYSIKFVIVDRVDNQGVTCCYCSGANTITTNIYATVTTDNGRTEESAWGTCSTCAIYSIDNVEDVDPSHIITIERVSL